MASRFSVNRPPTPEPEPELEEANVKRRRLSVEEIVDIKLIKSGEKERLKQLLRQRLVESGWEENIFQFCLEYLKSNEGDEVSIEELVKVATPKGRATVPGPVKAELLHRIKAILFDEEED